MSYSSTRESLYIGSSNSSTQLSGGAGANGFQLADLYTKVLIEFKAKSTDNSGYFSDINGTSSTSIIRTNLTQTTPSMQIGFFDTIQTPSSFTTNGRGLNASPFDYIQLPIAVSGIVFVFNLKNTNNEKITNINLNPTTIYKIFKGEITKWNDSLIVNLNPNLALPNTTIIVIYANLANAALNQAFGQWINYSQANVWTESQAWNGVKTGTSYSALSDGVSTVNNTDNSISFVDYNYTKGSFPNISLASIQNKAGVYVKPNAASLYSAAKTPGNVVSTTNLGTRIGSLLEQSNYHFIKTNSEDINKGSYPFAKLYYVIAYTKINTIAIKKFLYYLTQIGLGNADENKFGQNVAISNKYVPLPPSLSAYALSELAKIPIS
jgi:ABC-type phosphate transport system substrate-binding protein